jgi:hypothetical protein
MDVEFMVLAFHPQILTAAAPEATTPAPFLGGVSFPADEEESSGLEQQQPQASPPTTSHLKLAVTS